MTPDQLDAWRVAMGFNHDQAAEAVGVGRRTWSDYVKGRSPVPLLLALACAAVRHGLTEGDAHGRPRSQPLIDYERRLAARLEAELSDHGRKRR